MITNRRGGQKFTQRAEGDPPTSPLSRTTMRIDMNCKVQSGIHHGFFILLPQVKLKKQTRLFCLNKEPSTFGGGSSYLSLNNSYKNHKHPNQRDTIDICLSLECAPFFCLLLIGTIEWGENVKFFVDTKPTAWYVMIFPSHDLSHSPSAFQS